MPVNPQPPKPSGLASDGASPNPRLEATRRTILQAALEVFCEQTYGGARIEQIAERAGVATGTIYKHFPSKHALVNEVYRHWKARTREYSYAHHPGMTARERFSAWVEQVCRFSEEHPLAHEFLMTHFHAPYLDAESLAAGDPMDQLAVRLMSQGQAEGAIRPGDPELLMLMVVGLFAGVAREMRTRGLALAGDVRAFVEECAWDLLRNPATTKGVPGDPR